MSVKEIKKIIKLNSQDDIIYIRNNEIVQPEMNDTIIEIQASGDWNGFVTYTITLD